MLLCRDLPVHRGRTSSTRRNRPPQVTSRILDPMRADIRRMNSRRSSTFQGAAMHLLPLVVVFFSFLVMSLTAMAEPPSATSVPKAPGTTGSASTAESVRVHNRGGVTLRRTPQRKLPSRIALRSSTGGRIFWMRSSTEDCRYGWAYEADCLRVIAGRRRDPQARGAAFRARRFARTPGSRTSTSDSQSTQRSLVLRHEHRGEHSR
jgi:hypothetical protein